MGRSLEFSKSYLRERIPFYPWFFIPVIIFFLGHNNSSPFNYIASYSLLWGVFFFKILEDFFSWDYNNKNLDLIYTRGHKTFLVVPMLVCFFLFMSSAVMIYPVIINIYIICIMLLSIILYVVLKRNALIQYVYLLVFPLFLYIVSSMTDEGNILWVVLGSSFFIAKYVGLNHFKKSNPYMEVAILTSFIVSKYVLNF
jgi:hypothetical protein